MHEIKYLGIDIGGANLKVIGLNSHKEIIFVEYRKCKIWEGVEKLRKAFQKINKTVKNKSAKCAITMSAVTAGISGIFIETHDNPKNAPSDGANMVPLKNLGALIHSIMLYDNLSKNENLI